MEIGHFPFVQLSIWIAWRWMKRYRGEVKKKRKGKSLRILLKVKRGSVFASLSLSFTLAGGRWWVGLVARRNMLPRCRSQFGINDDAHIWSWSSCALVKCKLLHETAAKREFMAQHYYVEFVDMFPQVRYIIQFNSNSIQIKSTQFNSIRFKSIQFNLVQFARRNAIKSIEMR